MSVRTQPGHIEFTEIPSAFNASDSMIVRPFSANLLAQYGAMCGTPISPPIDDIFTIRPLPRSSRAVEPPYFARMLDVEAALAAGPPEVVVIQDLAAPAYTALRMRQLGFGFEHTLFVVYCHGTRRWITDTARKVRVLPGAHAVTILEQASIELADVVVSPSRYLVDWMRQQRWQLPPDTLVIPHLTRAVAAGEPQPRAEAGTERVRRLAFFGRLEERKGIRPFIQGLNALPAGLLHGLEVEFVGRATPAWTPERVKTILSESERMAEIVRKIGKITRYETKPYVGATQILDLDKSTES